ncbi:MAG: RNA-binding S4 domain-containing protein [Verrucomicrobiales bacterium]|nr:RNA-binding S4 domain-containing protein [Verrucomicrobiales bacterium]
MDQEKQESVRVDVWIWAVRLFKTRTMAAAACKNQQVLINGGRCKPARQVRIGDKIVIKRGIMTRTVEVKAILEKRVGAKLVDDFLIDHTPPEEYQQATEAARYGRSAVPQREPGSGRPTKRERRELDDVMSEMSEVDVSFEDFLKSFLENR